MEHTVEAEHKRKWWHYAGAVAGAVALLGLGIKTGSDGLHNYCEQRDMMAPGGHASPAELCEDNEAFRARMAGLLDSLRPQIINKPVFDVEE